MAVKNNVFYIIIYSLIVAVLYIKFDDLNIKHVLLPVISYILVLLGSSFYRHTFKYYRMISLWMTICLSIFIIVFSVDTINSIEGKECLAWIVFSSSLVQLILLINNIFKKISRFTLIIDVLLILASCIPILICWGYYVAANSWISVESCMAILQTNPMEAQNYISDHTSIVNIIVISMIFAMIILLIKIIPKEKTVVYKSTSLIMILFF